MSWRSTNQTAFLAGFYFRSRRQPIAADYFDSLNSFVKASTGRKLRKPMVVYAGTASQKRSKAEVVAWKDVAEVRWGLIGISGLSGIRYSRTANMEIDNQLFYIIGIKSIGTIKLVSLI